VAATTRGVGRRPVRGKVDWRAEARWLLPLALVYAGLEIALRWLAQAGALATVQAWTASAAHWLLGVFGVRTVIAGCSIVTAQGTVVVDGLCLPVTPLALGIALIVCATPGPAIRKIWLVGALVVALLLSSVVRIAAVAALVASADPLMATVHTTVSPIALTCVALGVWFLGLWVARCD